MILAKLRELQPVVIQILENSLTHQQLSHAYLFSGSLGTLTKEAAILMAQTMVCEDKQGVFACEVCNSCRRVSENQFTDVIVIDGYNRNIRKEEILDLQSRFMQTSLEQAGQKVYVIHHIENATIEALNSLLKFLEEPQSKDMLAILTSENPDKLLPTILSRVQIVPFLAQAANHLEVMLESELDDALMRKLVAHLTNDVASALALATDEQFLMVFDVFRQFIEKAQNSVIEANIYLQREGFNLKSAQIKQNVEYFSQIAYIFFKESAYQKMSDTEWWDAALALPRFQKVSLQAMTLFNEAKDKVMTNANMNLLLDQMMINLNTMMEE
ncbi:MAG: DNA polymerase III subunit delta [Erysipelothrix sp.]|jgi:DNA polymerase-3 subunit delta'|nr:DNA polymerase III subunit delta [Erysipelothrix sp.]